METPTRELIPQLINQEVEKRFQQLSSKKSQLPSSPNQSSQKTVNNQKPQQQKNRPMINPPKQSNITSSNTNSKQQPKPTNITRQNVGHQKNSFDPVKQHLTHNPKSNTPPPSTAPLAPQRPYQLEQKQQPPQRILKKNVNFSSTPKTSPYFTQKQNPNQPKPPMFTKPDRNIQYSKNAPSHQANDGWERTFQ